MDYIYYFALLLILFFPTFVANASPILIKNVPYIKKYNKPVHEKIFGKNKTYRGIITGILFAVICSLVTFFVVKFLPFTETNNLYYAIIGNTTLAIFSGILQGVGALGGDLVESAIKRKIGKKPGEAWPFWDGVDYIIGSLLLFSVIFVPNIWGIIFLIFFAPAISLIANIISYLIGWKNVWY